MHYKGQNVLSHAIHSVGFFIICSNLRNYKIQWVSGSRMLQAKGLVLLSSLDGKPRTLCWMASIAFAI